MFLHRLRDGKRLGMKIKYNQIYQGDCVEVIKKNIKANSIDLIYADPPYNLSGKSLNLINNTTGGAFYKMRIGILGIIMIMLIFLGNGLQLVSTH